METKWQPLQWLWHVRVIEFENPLEKLLAYEMLAYADASGESHPSIAQLRLALGVGETQTKKLRKSLVNRSLLKLVKKGNGPGEWSVYGLINPVTLPSDNPVTGSDHLEGHIEVTTKIGESGQSVALAGDDDSSEVGADSAAPPKSSQPHVQDAPALEEGEDLLRECEGCYGDGQHNYRPGDCRKAA
jgi:hypothetical protein